MSAEAEKPNEINAGPENGARAGENLDGSRD